ncbi:DNA polymerase beta superfamily protein [Spongisporangium articulatum]|uniref:DNA polymerase beta superfamily protein n=1 Tax=Spongisporangium articulatum TaxID=3362603 RepID=A0ABW8AS03_9ACTN
MTTEYGDREVARQGEILRATVGSGVHGIAIAGTDDHDEMGVYVEPPEHALSLAPVQPHYVWRTQPEGARSGPGDVDLVSYSLRKYLRLALKGNPTALLPLYAPEADLLHVAPLGEELRAMRAAFLSRQAAHRFLGFMRSQRDRMVAGRDVPNRPELVARYGYDVKYASHALRLAVQGLEVTRRATLTLPMPDDERELVLSVKRGEHEQGWVLERIDATAARVEELLATGRTPLPEYADVDRVQAWCTGAYRRAWRW